MRFDSAKITKQTLKEFNKHEVSYIFSNYSYTKLASISHMTDIYRLR